MGLVDLSAAEMAGFTRVQKETFVFCMFAVHIKTNSHGHSVIWFLLACRGVWGREKD